jgi:hypothetical protein
VQKDETFEESSMKNFVRQFMQAIKQTVLVDADRHVCIRVPLSFGKQVEVIILPVSSPEKPSQFIECVGEDKTAYRLTDWTDEDFNRESQIGAVKDDDTIAEEILTFDIGHSISAKCNHADGDDEFYRREVRFDSMIVMRSIQTADESGVIHIKLPQNFGKKVELIVLPLSEAGVGHDERWEMMRLQASSGFAQKVLSNPAEDVWNDL